MTFRIVEYTVTHNVHNVLYAIFRRRQCRLLFDNGQQQETSTATSRFDFDDESMFFQRRRTLVVCQEISIAQTLLVRCVVDLVWIIVDCCTD